MLKLSRYDLYLSTKVKENISNQIELNELTFK